VLAVVGSIFAGLYAVFIIYRRRHAKASAQNGSTSSFLKTPSHHANSTSQTALYGTDRDTEAAGEPITMQQQKPVFARADTSYSRVAAHEADLAGNALPLPQMIHEHHRNRESTGTMDPLVRYGDGGLAGEEGRASGTHSRSGSGSIAGHSRNGSGSDFGGYGYGRESGYSENYGDIAGGRYDNRFD
jgi:hypothetical protein